MAKTHIILNEAEAKVAFRDYISKYVETDVDVWGQMELLIDGNRVGEAHAIFPYKSKVNTDVEATIAVDERQAVINHLWDTFESMCDKQQFCEDCEYKGYDLGYKCLIAFIVDNYDLKAKKEVCDDNRR